MVGRRSGRCSNVGMWCFRVESDVVTSLMLMGGETKGCFSAALSSASEAIPRKYHTNRASVQRSDPEPPGKSSSVLALVLTESRNACAVRERAGLCCLGHQQPGNKAWMWRKPQRRRQVTLNVWSSRLSSPLCRCVLGLQFLWSLFWKVCCDWSPSKPPPLSFCGGCLLHGCPSCHIPAKPWYGTPSPSPGFSYTPWMSLYCSFVWGFILFWSFKVLCHSFPEGVPCRGNRRSRFLFPFASTSEHCLSHNTSLFPDTRISTENLPAQNTCLRKYCNELEEHVCKRSFTIWHAVCMCIFIFIVSVFISSGYEHIWFLSWTSLQKRLNKICFFCNYYDIQ